MPGISRYYSPILAAQEHDMTTESQILAIARAVRFDAWVDFAARGAFSVGFSNNADPASYNASMGDMANLLRAAGFGVSVRAADAHHACTIVTVRA